MNVPLSSFAVSIHPLDATQEFADTCNSYVMLCYVLQLKKNLSVQPL